MRVSEAVVAEKFLLVPDCDDDRRALGAYINPRHARASQEVYCKSRVRVGAEVVRAYRGEGGVVALRPEDSVSGWHPAMTLVIEGGARRPLRPGEVAEWAANGRSLRCRGGVEARWFCSSTGAHRISVRGGDDLALGKAGLSEVKARALWDRLRDFVTMKTLRRLGFVPC